MYGNSDTNRIRKPRDMNGSGMQRPVVVNAIPHEHSIADLPNHTRDSARVICMPERHVQQQLTPQRYLPIDFASAGTRMEVFYDDGCKTNR